MCKTSHKIELGIALSHRTTCFTNISVHLIFFMEILSKPQAVSLPRFSLPVVHACSRRTHDKSDSLRIRGQPCHLYAPQFANLACQIKQGQHAMSCRNEVVFFNSQMRVYFHSVRLYENKRKATDPGSISCVLVFLRESRI